MISYAQNREDVLLQRVFREREHGFYVDVGAFDPSLGSLTKHFYDKGWRGINIEPGQVFERLRAERPGDINLNVAISDQCGLVTFYEHPPDPGTSTLVAVLDPALAHCRAGRVARCVEATTLRQVLERFQPGEIDFLKIDVEGHERQVLLGNDWGRFRPRVLVIEATLPYSNTPCHERWEEVILQAGYFYAHFDGLNRYYVREEDAALLGEFAAPVNVLDQYVPVEMVRYQTLAEQLQDQLREIRVRLEGMEGERARIQAEADRLFRDIQRIDYSARQSEADRSRLQGEVDRLHQTLQHLGGVAQQRQVECHRLSEAVRQQATARQVLQEELDRLRAEQAALRHGTGPTSLRMGLCVARALYRLKHPFAARKPRIAVRKPDSAVVSGVPTAPGTLGIQLMPFRKPMKSVATACLRPFHRLAKALGRPLAWRLRMFLIQPVLAEQRAIAPPLAVQLRKHRDELAQGLTDIRTLVQQLVQLVGQVREQHSHVLSQLEGQQGVIRETDRMLLALLKTAQFGPLTEPTEALPRLYRQCENL
jgi:FkbM family methyltransferase